MPYSGKSDRDTVTFMFGGKVIRLIYDGNNDLRTFVSSRYKISRATKAFL
jgi:hypothetical protein